MSRNNLTWLAVAIVAALAFAGGSIITTGVTIVDRIADAIAFAEGFYTSGSRAWRNNNPGDLTYAFGFPTTGMDGPFPVFQTIDAGWAALKTQIGEMLDNTSSIYNSAMTIAQIGASYAGGDPNWAHNVAARLGVTVDTVISQV